MDVTGMTKRLAMRLLDTLKAGATEVEAIGVDFKE